MADARDREPGDAEADEAREDRSTGGDAPAAGSIEEREAVARDDDLFEGDEPDDADGGDAE